MQKLLKFPVYILVAGLVLGSCSELSIFTPSIEESVGIKILSLSEGDFLQSGESVDFLIQTEDQSTEPVLLEIALTTQSGQSVWSTSIASPLTDEELELLLPDLETGQYTIEFTVHSEEGVIEKEHLSFFYIAGQYDILGITSFPPTVMAGHESVIEADLLYPAGSNPYIRWTQDGTILATGPVSEGFQSITWPAPEEEGVYSIRVEMFPVPPPAGGDFSFSSSLSLTARLYVSTKSILTEDELVPEDSYYSLFHLNGSLANTGVLGTEAAQKEARLIGDAGLSTEGGIMGYKLKAGGGIVYPLNVLPILNGQLPPCTVTFRLIPAGQSEGQNLLSISDQAGEFRFRIFFDKDGQLTATLGYRGILLRLPSNIYGLEEKLHYRLDLSLVPTESGLRALWFLDGEQTASVTEAPLPSDLPVNGETTIAGENGFEGTITEFGVYFRDEFNRPSVDPSIYREAMMMKYGRLLVLAEGFEGLYLPDPDSWRLEPTDEVYLRGGRLILTDSSSLTLPYFELGKKDTAFTVEFFGEIPPGSTVALQWEGAEEPFLVVDPTGEIRSAEESEKAEEFSPSGTILRLTLALESVTLFTANDPILYPVEAPADPNTWLSVILQSPGPGRELKIDTILIVQVPSS
ncbi:MAG: hypothetical protein V3V57_12450 [Spirochaetia bacterium]